MAGYRTVDELMDILEEECLEFDAVVSIVGAIINMTIKLLRFRRKMFI